MPAPFTQGMAAADIKNIEQNIKNIEQNIRKYYAKTIWKWGGLVGDMIASTFHSKNGSCRY